MWEWPVDHMDPLMCTGTYVVYIAIITYREVR
jgi:hypothetical protein